MSNILTSVENFFKDEEAKILKDFGDIGPWLKQVALPVASQVINVFKAIDVAADTDSLDIVGKLIGGVAGAGIEDKVRAALDKVVPQLTLAQQFLSLGDTNAILQAIVKQLPTLTTNARALFLAEFAAQISAVLAGGNITIQSAWALAQWYFQNNPTNATLTPASSVTPPPTIATEATTTTTGATIVSNS